MFSTKSKVGLNFTFILSKPTTASFISFQIIRESLFKYNSSHSAKTNSHIYHDERLTLTDKCIGFSNLTPLNYLGRDLYNNSLDYSGLLNSK